MQEKMFWLTFNNQHSNNPATRSLIDNGEIQLWLPVFFLFYLRVLVRLFRFPSSDSAYGIKWLYWLSQAFTVAVAAESLSSDDSVVVFTTLTLRVALSTLEITCQCGIYPLSYQWGHEYKARHADHTHATTFCSEFRFRNEFTWVLEFPTNKL